MAINATTDIKTTQICQINIKKRDVRYLKKNNVSNEHTIIFKSKHGDLSIRYGSANWHIW